MGGGEAGRNSTGGAFTAAAAVTMLFWDELAMSMFIERATSGIESFLIRGREEGRDSTAEAPSWMKSAAVSTAMCSPSKSMAGSGAAEDIALSSTRSSAVE
jgi:hypothetical protein